MVAKSYQSMKQLGDPFCENGRMYVNVEAKNGKARKVRFYTEDEYYKMYPNEERPGGKLFTNQKKLLGFDKGYITIFKGDTEKYDYWFSHSIARFCRFWGWYIVSTETIPFDLPADIEPVRLDWEQVGSNSGELKDEAEVEAIVSSILCGQHPSTFQGLVGERLELDLIVIKNVQKETDFRGKKSTNTVHTFEDLCGNHYVWDTGAKNWAEGSAKRVRATVKEHKIINNIQTTVLTRCMEVMK